MQPPDELMVQVFLPSMRLLVAKSLMKQGLSQARVSSLLGVTQASVSHYGSADPEKAYSSLQTLSVGRAEADRFAGILSADLKKDPARSVGTLTAIWGGLLGRGAACPAHRAAYPSLEGCDVCLKAYGGAGARDEAVSQVAEAIRLLESSPAFARVMPEVAVNIACIAGDSDAPGDVVSIPGRIVKVKDSAKAAGPPSFGASKHLAGVLLLVRKRRPDLRAVINLRYDSTMARVLRSLGMNVLEIGGYRQRGRADPTLQALAERLRGGASRFDAVADKGAEGIEPSLYLFGGGAPQVAELAIRVADGYSAG